MSIKEDHTSLENCDIYNGDIHHTEDCTCTIEDVASWYEDKADLETDRYLDEGQ